jgi:hypothetical protein
MMAKSAMKDAGGRVGEFAPDGALEDHFLTLAKNCSDNRLLVKTAL